VPSLTVALVLTIAVHAGAAPVIGSPTTDSNGVLHYPVTSSYEAAAPNDLRILLPQSFGTGQRRFLWALPVEPGTAASYGDPVDTIRALGAVDAMHVILVVPAFSLTPWYADHPTDPTIFQESYLVDDLVPAVEALYPETPSNVGPPRRLLVGFSKSGMGALSLILRHSTLFDAAAMWDAPLNQTALSSLPGMTTVFGNQANYDTYAIPNVLPQHVAEFSGPARLWLGGYSGWRKDMTAAHDAMTALGITHVWMDGPQRAHRWDSGWVSDALGFLDQAAPALVIAADAGTEADASLDASVDAADHDASDAPADAGLDAASADGGTHATASSEGGGCGCSEAGGARGSVHAIGLLGLLGVWRRRRAGRARLRISARRTTWLG